MNEIYEVDVMTGSGAIIRRRVRAKSEQNAKHSVCVSLGLTLNHAIAVRKI